MPSFSEISPPVPEEKIFEGFLLGMSFGVRFKVRTFGNKHPDGSNVRIFSDQVNIICTFT